VGLQMLSQYTFVYKAVATHHVAMKLYCLLALAAALASSVHGNFRIRRLDSDEDAYVIIASDDYEGYLDPSAPSSACIQVRNDNPRNNQKLVLGDCQGPKPGWRFDADGLVHTELDDSWCIQAGKGGPVTDGEFARMKRCDPFNELQKFVYVNGGGIRPLSNQGLCMVWRGTHASVGVDPIIFKDCVEADARVDWSGI